MANDLLRGSWRRKYGHTKLWQQKVLNSIIHHVGFGFAPKEPLKKARLTITRCSSKAPDYDGLVSGAKPIIDALVKLKIIEDDNISVIGQPTFLWEKGKKGQGKMKVKVEEINTTNKGE